MHNKKNIPIRRLAREWTLRLLYQWEIRQEPLRDLEIEDLPTFIQELEPLLGSREVHKIMKLSLELYRGVLDHITEIDEPLRELSHNWKLNRMALVDRNILRISIFEILFREDIPKAVSINEAIEIAKLYGNEDSGRFVNGILDKTNKQCSYLQKI